VLTLYKLDLTGPSGVVKITAIEAAVLSAFTASPDARIDFQKLAEYMGMPDVLADNYKANIQVRMFRLRKKLVQVGAEGAVIEPIRNFGYEFFADLEIRKS
jgi:DNA-binding response OmpR family regulator